MNPLVNSYLNSWAVKRIDYELMVKGRAKINNDGWRKLRNYHLRNYLKSLDNPFAFLFLLKFKHKSIFKQVSSASTLYYRELKARNEGFNITTKIPYPAKM